MTKQELKQLIKEVLSEAVTKKTFRVSLDRPGAGWEEIVKASNMQQAIKIANDMHKFESPADTYYEIPDEPKTKSSPSDEQIIDAMIQSGDKFAQFIGRAAKVANADKYGRLKDAFPELWDSFRRLLSEP